MTINITGLGQLEKIARANPTILKIEKLKTLLNPSLETGCHRGCTDATSSDNRPTRQEFERVMTGLSDSEKKTLKDAINASDINYYIFNPTSKEMTKRKLI